jgi:hypothetical protein
MVFIASFWAAVINLLLLVVAVALHPASLDGLHWLRDLPWPWFGTELLGIFDMQLLDAGALWALWICVTGVLLVGSTLAYAALELAGRSVALPPAPEPQVAALFGDLSNGMAGLGGFGNSELRDLGVAPSLARQAQTADVVDTERDAPAVAISAPAASAPDIAASLQQIDPQLSASYDALLRELKSPRSL